MAASLDGFIARKDGRVDWLETSDEFVGGATMDPGFVEAFLKSIDCYVMGSRTYETALSFEAKGLGWAYGDKPIFVLTSRQLPRTRDTVEFYSGDLAQFVKGRLRPAFRSIWFVGGGAVSGECLRLGLADEVRYSASSAESVGSLRFWKSSQGVIQGHFHGFVSAKSVGTSGHHSNLVVEPLDRAAGYFPFSLEPVEQ
jgi:dihydrofolate reductase